MRRHTRHSDKRLSTGQVSGSQLISCPGLNGFQAGNPAGNAGAEFLVFFPEFLAQRRLFIKNNESEKPQTYHNPILEQPDAAEEQSLAEEKRRNGNIHRVAHVAIESGYYQPLGGSDGRGRPQPLYGEKSKGIKQDRKPGDDHQGSDDAERVKAEQRRGEAPATNRPGDIHGKRPRSDNQKDR
jgi:hypothetical protein